MQDNNKEKPTGISRIHKLTYGLIYPAFIGNMIYDIVQFLFGAQPDIKWTNVNLGIITGIFIVIFYSLDYVLLHSDLDYRTTKVQKDLVYTLCDFATSCLFFLAFVFSKYGNIKASIICMSIIPFVFLIYNWRLKINKWTNLAFGIISFFVMIGYFYFESHSAESTLKPKSEIFLLVISIAYTTAYFIYNLIYFWVQYSSEKEIMITKQT